MGVDISASALKLAEENARLNDLSGISFIHDNVFDRLDMLARSGERFGLVVLDPPKFARTRQAVQEALRGHRRLHTRALHLLEPDGILVTCCCSGLVSRKDFEKMLVDVAIQSRRHIRILEARGAAPDHPISPFCPENDYLKCYICSVE